jgi:hypothetical protein
MTAVVAPLQPPLLQQRVEGVEPEHLDARGGAERRAARVDEQAPLQAGQRRDRLQPAGVVMTMPAIVVEK